MKRLPSVRSKQLLKTPLARSGLHEIAPTLIKRAGNQATKRFYEFFTANIRNRNTREAYHRAIVDFFAWSEARGLQLDDLEPMVVAA